MQIEKGRDCSNAISPKAKFLEELTLEVDPRDDLDKASAWIVGRRGVTECFSNLSEGCSADTDAVDVIAGVADDEVDIIERVEELAPQLKVDRFSDPETLHSAQVETHELRTVKDHV